jgi:hypothetical protein
MGRSKARVDNTLVKALARAFRWRTLLETGIYATVEEIGAAKKIDAAGAVDRRGHTGWAAGSRDDPRSGHAAIPDGVERTNLAALWLGSIASR